MNKDLQYKRVTTMMSKEQMLVSKKISDKTFIN